MSIFLSWRYWEPKLYRCYYHYLPGSYAAKRGFILWLHQRCRWLTRYTTSYRLHQRAHSHIAELTDPQRLAEDYAAWRQRYVDMHALQRLGFNYFLRRWQRQQVLPRFAVIVWCLPTAPQAVKTTLAALKQQLYPQSGWQLLVRDSAPGPEHMAALLTQVTADYIVLLEAGDRLPEMALYRLAQAILTHPEGKIFYSDQDVITATGNYAQPYFKPAWNPQLALSHDLIGQLAAYHHTLLTAMTLNISQPGWRYDLALQLTEQVRPEAIQHVPYVLCSRPGRPHSVQTTQTAVISVNQALQRRGVAAYAEASSLAAGAVRVGYALPSSPPKVSLIIPTRDGLHWLRQCLRSLIKQTDYPYYELLIVDNGSVEPETLAFLRGLPQQYPHIPVTIIPAPGEFNFSKLNNLAAAQAQGEVLGLLNNDLEFKQKGWLKEMLSHACQPDAGAVGARLLYPDGRLQHAGVIVGLGQAAGHVLRYYAPGQADHFGPPGLGRSRLVQNVSAVTAACLLVRKCVYQEVGGLDEIEFAVAFNDIDFCLKLCRAGYHNVYTPFATVYHHESVSRGSDHEHPHKAARYAQEMKSLQQRWHTHHCLDPAYSRNFCAADETCAYAFPPQLPLGAIWNRWKR